MNLAIQSLISLRSVIQHGQLIRTMMIRDLRSRYAGSLLGIFWSVINPAIHILLYYFIFAVILKIRLGPEYGGTSFALWLVSGLLPWMFFSEVFTRSPNAVLEQATLITKSVFPSEVLPVAHLGAAFLNHIIGLAILICFLVATGGGVSVSILMLVPGALAIGTLALGLAWMVSAISVFIRDIAQIIGVVANIWFFMTPIMYPRHLIPDNLQGIYSLNPMLHFVEFYRAALLGKSPFPVGEFVAVVFPSVIVFVAGGIVFKKLKPMFPDVL